MASVPVSLAASGQVVAAIAGKRIRVLGVGLVGLLATQVKFQSNATDITGAMPFAANGGVVMPAGEQPWFETAIGEALNINMNIATTLGGVVQYEVA